MEESVMGLIAHTDTDYVNEQAVREVAEPEWTKTWHPVGHGRLIDALEAGVNDHNLHITKRQYSLSVNGKKLFGVWELDDAVTDGMKLSMGFRNAIDKTMTIGICAGVTVFVCDNLAFSGDMILFRKHTSGLNDETLSMLSMEAVSQVIEKMTGYRDWINGLKEEAIVFGNRRAPYALEMYPDVMSDDPVDFGILHTNEFKALTYDMAFDARVFPMTSIPDFIESFKEEAMTAIEMGYPINSWYTVFNSVTRLYRGKNHFAISVATARLEQLIREAI